MCEIIKQAASILGAGVDSNPYTPPANCKGEAPRPLSLDKSSCPRLSVSDNDQGTDLSHDQPTPGDEDPDVEGNISPHVLNVDGSPSLDQQLVCGKGQSNYFQVVDRFIGEGLDDTTSDDIITTSTDDDVLAIRAILCAWDTIIKRIDNYRRWKLLRALDKGLFYRTGQVERVAILRVMRSLLMVGPFSLGGDIR